MMLVTWLIELYLNQLGDLRDKGEKGEENYKLLEEDFRKFLHQSRVQVSMFIKSHITMTHTIISHIFSSLLLLLLLFVIVVNTVLVLLGTK